MANFTHSGVVNKFGKKRMLLRKSVKNWHCENGCIFDSNTGLQKNGNRKGWLDLQSIEAVKNG